ncbi:MAG: hypothetical protein JOZ15_16500, partial [Acidobacteria bacterium]|nr:hypothetical protein [Acidobacteriota bacterium]
MPRPAVLVVDPQASRRRELSRGLTSLGYEVIPAVDERQGRLFAAELAPAVVVAPLGFLDAAEVAGWTLPAPAAPAVPAAPATPEAPADSGTAPAGGGVEPAAQEETGAA